MGPVRTCTHCGLTKNLDLFVKNRHCLAGRTRKCKACQSKLSAAWSKAHPEQRREINRRSVKADPIKTKAYNNKYMKNLRLNPLHAFAQRISNALYKALRGVYSDKAGRATVSLVGYSKQELYDHLMAYMGAPCAWCSQLIQEISAVAIDHIVPLRTAASEQEVLALNQLSNLRLLHKFCNGQKGGKLESSLATCVP